jgi:hypothetical protein
LRKTIRSPLSLVNIRSRHIRSRHGDVKLFGLIRKGGGFIHGLRGSLALLVAELRRQVAVFLLHLCVRDGRQFFVTRLMRCDLCRSCASYTLLVEAPGFADSVDQRRPNTLAVPSDLRLATPAPFNVIAWAFYSKRQL